LWCTKAGDVTIDRGGAGAAASTPRSTTWPALATCAFTVAYGALKLYWALGGTTLLAEAPLPRTALELALARDAGIVASHWVSVGLAIVGVLVALATIQGWGRSIPRWMLLNLAWLVCVAMVLRAVFHIVGDVQGLIADGFSEAGARVARWDLLLWSPYFLVWGILWGMTAWHYQHRRDLDR
jgi:hypothetical protein